MIITKSPLRISICGGGTDLPSYSNLKGGFCISAAINKYIYIIINKSFRKGIILKYSKHEYKNKIQNIKHPIFRETIKEFNLKYKINFSNIEIISAADIPQGTGLGSSGAFTVALIYSISKYFKINLNKKKIAEMACKIEIKKLKNSSGKQDQYISTFGGIKKIIFKKNGTTSISKLKISKYNLSKFKKSILIYFTGKSRNASLFLKKQDESTKKNKKSMIENLDGVKKIAFEFEKNLKKGNINKIGNTMQKHWVLKKQRDKKISNKKINSIYEYALKNGAIGGKLIGAGGGGFLMLLTNSRKKLENKLKKFKLKKLDFNFNYTGVHQIINSKNNL